MLPDAPLIVLAAPAFVLALYAIRLAFAHIGQPEFSQRALLNKGETRLFMMIREELPHGYSVHPQVSYGEFLQCESRRKFMAINARRADMIICDEAMAVVAAVELQGSGHWGSTFADRAVAVASDRIKRRALKEAGIPLIEISGRFGREQVRDGLAPVIAPQSQP